jgi:hypothetical protein
MTCAPVPCLRENQCRGAGCERSHFGIQVEFGFYIERPLPFEANSGHPNVGSEEFRQNLGCRTFNNFIEGIGVHRLLRPDINCADTSLIGDMYEARGGINRA